MQSLSKVLQNYLKVPVVCAILLCAPSVGSAFEVTILEKGPTAKKPLRFSKAEPIFPRATAADVMCGKSHHMARFRLNGKHAGLPFSITAKKMTRIKIRWDHSDKVLLPLPEKNKTIVFPHAGGESHLYFRAHAPISGNIYLMDDKNVVIKKCPYSFLPVKRYRQSVNVSVNETEFDRISDDSNNKNVSVSYRIKSKSAVPEGATWSLSVGVSESESSTDSRRVNSSFSYSW